MNIIELAKQAGIGPVTIAALEFEEKRLTRFAALVRNATLEECASEFEGQHTASSEEEAILAAADYMRRRIERNSTWKAAGADILRWLESVEARRQ